MSNNIKNTREKKQFEKIVSLLIDKFLDNNSTHKFDYSTNIDIKALFDMKNFEDFVNINDCYSSNFIIKNIEDLLVREIINRLTKDIISNTVVLKNLYNDVKSNIQKYTTEIINALNIYVETTLFHSFSAYDINYLSLKNLESKTCKGNIAICHDRIENIELVVEFEKANNTISSTPNEEDLKYLRKLIELTNTNIDPTNKDTFLIIQNNNDSLSVLGLAKKETVRNLNLPYIQINGKMNWDLNVYGSTLSFSNGKYTIKDMPATNSVVEELCNTMGIKNCHDDLISLLNRIKKYSHGALLIFTESTEQIKELCDYNRGIKIENSSFLSINKDTIDIITNLCSIDGAIVFNKNCELISIGTILDGKALTKGHRGRGSRYNSSITFVKFYSEKYKPNKFCAVVVSEDGYINLIK